MEFLGYFFSLKNDHDLKQQKLKICTEILKNNLNRSKQLPITALGREVFGRTYLSSVFLYHLICNNYNLTELKETQKVLDKAMLQEKSRYNVFF